MGALSNPPNSSEFRRMSVSSAALAAPSPLLHPGCPRWVAVAVACLSSFMVVMDGAIVNVALPAMQADLGLSAVELQWVVDAYLLTLGGFMLLTARAGDLYGRKAILQSGLVLFTLASLAGGFAASGPALLAARAFQGLGASALATSTLAVIVAVHPNGSGRETAISLWAASSALAAAFGVTIGGVLTAFADWRWVMFVNAPVGALLSLIVAASLKPPAPAAQRPTLDLVGALAITLCLGSFILGVTQSVHWGWESPLVRGALGGALALLVLFVAVEARVEQPLVRLGIFRLRNILFGNALVMGLGAALTTSMFLLSVVLQRIAGYGALDAGLAMLPMSLSLAVAAIASRPLRDAGFNRLPFVGGLVGAVGMAWLSRIPAAPDYAADLLGPTLLVGGGLGLMIMTATQAALAGVPGKDVGLASGLLNTARQLGGAVGVAALATLAQAVARDAAGEGSVTAALAGYHAAFLATAAVCVTAALASLFLRRSPE
jgi:EmrB/QacA subfamily drug resistance transporter